jgi:shikimate dehydrogenase
MKFALLGKSLSHSFSKSFFIDFFATNGIEATYENIELFEIKDVVSVLNSKKYNGFNVTIPYKESIIPYLDKISEEASVIGSVNTIKRENNLWVGYNTDAFGFQQSIKPFLTNLHERAIIIGTGGASKAIAYILKNIGISCVYISREPSLLNHFPYEAINEYMLRACKLVVNCTPVGTFPDIDEEILFPYYLLTNEHLVIDLIYNPKETRFLHNAKKNGATILNGESMLKEQALKSWEIWKV